MLRYRRLLFFVCHRFASNALTADDLLQETTIALWRRRGQLISITSHPKQAAWIWRVARSTCIDLLRHTRESMPLPDEFDPPYEDTSLHNELLEHIATLDEPDRTIVTLYLQGYEYSEIGRVTGMKKNAVGTRLMRIKDKLREKW